MLIELFRVGSSGESGKLDLSPGLRACRFSPWVDRDFGSVAALSEGSGCGKCKRVHERVASILPFSVSEKIADKPLQIRGLAMTTGLSRNFNLYTPEELEAFSGKLTDAPVYLEHVSVNNAVGKVTKTDWDGQNLLYEAENYDEDTAAKNRKGLIQHVYGGFGCICIHRLHHALPYFCNFESFLAIIATGEERNDFNANVS